MTAIGAPRASSPLKNFLICVGLRFESDSDEAAFFKEFALDRKGQAQAALALGGVLLYIYFVWDRIIDPVGAQTTTLIRGLILAPFTWAMALVLFARASERWFETICTTGAIVVSLGLSVVGMLLKGGFNLCVTGIMLFVFFVITALPVRVPAFAAICIVTWPAFFVFEQFGTGTLPGMWIVNNLCIATAWVLGLFAAAVRETVARRQFRMQRELGATRSQVGVLRESNRVLEAHNRRILEARAASIVVSYRRSDADAIAGRIRDRLVGQFGEHAIFMDIDSIPIGFDFREQIRVAMQNTDVVVAIIGPHWTGMTGDGHVRIDDATDPVRIELEMALQRQIPIIPVLVGEATMPAATDLPPSLRELSFRNAVQVSSGVDFHPHADRLLRSIDRILAERHEGDLGRKSPS